MKEQDTLWISLQHCPICNKEMVKSETKVAGQNVRAWKCMHCEKIVPYPEDLRKAERIKSKES